MVSYNSHNHRYVVDDIDEEGHNEKRFISLIHGGANLLLASMVENGISIFNKVFLTSPLSWSVKLATVVSLDLSCSSNSVSLLLCVCLTVRRYHVSKRRIIPLPRCKVDPKLHPQALFKPKQVHVCGVAL